MKHYLRMKSAPPGESRASRLGKFYFEAITTSRDELINRELAHKEISAAFAAATRDFGEALYSANATLASAKGFLYARGAKVADKKASKKKKPVAEAKSPEVPASP